MVSKIRPHHQRAIENLVKEYENDPRFMALIIGGSVAKNCARADSDVDFMIVATDDTYQTRQAKGNLFINRTDLCDYPGGFVDGKIINRDYLHQVALKGNEPSRAAFDGAFMAYSHLEGLEALLKKIVEYPESEREIRLKKFYSAAFIQNWLMGEAERHQNIYTMTRAASQLALYASRLVLAHNRVLFPYHKWLLYYLEKCSEMPVNFIDNIHTLLKAPSIKTSNAVFEGLKNYKDWGITDHEAYMWFMEEVEWSWIDDKTPLEDL